VKATPLPAGVDLHSLHRLAPERYPFLLQSTATSSTLGGFDVLFLTRGEALILEQPGVLSGHAANNQSEFLPALDAWWQQERVDSTDDNWPFTGGWFLYLGYELAAEVEPKLELQPDPIMPTAFAVRCPAAIIRNHQDRKCFLINESSGGIDPAVVLEDVAATETLNEAQSLEETPEVVEEDPSLFLDAVAKAKQYIARGDVYQANLSRGWSATMDHDIDANRIYRALRTANPGPFAGLINWRGVSVVSSSPERLLQVKNGIASTRPIAGTRPRSTDKAEDQKLLEELLAHPKERAEHVMLIDLERNDLGRVCDPGTVEVDEMMVVESYAHVHHIVSNVRGLLRKGVTPGEVIRAVFPGGTITGCPKVRCMEIISELETGPRGAYTGSFGYLNRDGSLDLNILIRTLVIRDNQVTFRAGSGIVADSEPEAELSETRDKAKGLVRALSL
jgi:anthranilate synthase component 1